MGPICLKSFDSAGSATASRKILRSMDIVTLLIGCPPLLDACVSGETNTFRALREINKEASCLITKAHLKHYKLTLFGKGNDSNEGMAGLLRAARLTSLHVKLFQTDSFSPIEKLDNFLQQMGASLHTVTSLQLRVQVTHGIGFPTPQMYDVLATLFGSLPALTSLHFKGQLFHEILGSFGKACSLLSSLTIQLSSTMDFLRMYQIMLRLNVLLPQLRSLNLQLNPHHEFLPKPYCDIEHYYGSFTAHFQLPRLANHTGILRLDLQGQTLHLNSWDKLPSQLEHISCGYLEVGPATTAAGNTLERFHHLQSFKTHFVDMPLSALAQLLRAAPSLRTLMAAHRKNAGPTIKCALLPSTAKDLAFLYQHKIMDLVGNSVFQFDERKSDLSTSAQIQIISALPLMKRVCKCEIIFMRAATLGPLMRVFPDIMELILKSMDDISNDVLHALTACTQLTSLTLKSCRQVSITGLIYLCQHMPSLVKVTCMDCPRLTASTLEYCVQFLQRQSGLIVEMVDASKYLKQQEHKNACIYIAGDALKLGL